MSFSLFLHQIPEYSLLSRILFPCLCSLTRVPWLFFPDSYSLVCVPQLVFPEFSPLTFIPWFVFPDSCSVTLVPFPSLQFPDSCSVTLVPFPWLQFPDFCSTYQIHTYFNISPFFADLWAYSGDRTRSILDLWYRDVCCLPLGTYWYYLPVWWN